jgi:triosephosphate isomerase
MPVRKKIAAANWKMNLTWQQGNELVSALLQATSSVKDPSQVILAVPFPYLQFVKTLLEGHEGYQEIAGVRTPFSDVEQARRALEARRAAQREVA